KSKPVRAVRHELCRKLIARSCESGCDCFVAEPQAGVGDRHYRGGNTTSIHILDRFFRSPCRVSRLQQRTTFDFSHPCGRSKMMVNVDTVRFGRTGLREISETGTSHRRQPQRSESSIQEGSSVEVAHESSQILQCFCGRYHSDLRKSKQVTLKKY